MSTRTAPGAVTEHGTEEVAEELQRVVGRQAALTLELARLEAAIDETERRTQALKQTRLAGKRVWPRTLLAFVFGCLLGTTLTGLASRVTLPPDYRPPPRSTEPPVVIPPRFLGL